MQQPGEGAEASAAAQAGRAAKLQGKLDAAKGHLQACSDPTKRQRIADNVAGLELQLAQLQSGGGNGSSAAAAPRAAGAAGAAEGQAVGAGDTGAAAAAHGLAEPSSVSDAADTAVDVYRDLKDDKAASRAGLCIVEGPETIKMLLRSELEVASVFVKPTVFVKLAPELAERQRRTGRAVDVLTAPHQLMAQVVGYGLNRGALAAGVVPTGRDLPWLRRTVLRESEPSWRILAIDTTYDPANLGGMIRSASAFGIDAVLLSADSVDAWYRRAVRVSMGHVFRVPVVRCADLAATLAQLEAEAGCVSYAAVIDADAQRLGAGGFARPPPRWCVVFGNEDTGVGEGVRRLCGERRVRINMARGVDSLNIGVAAGILLHWFAEHDGRPGWADGGEVRGGGDEGEGGSAERGAKRLRGAGGGDGGAS